MSDEIRHPDGRIEHPSVRHETKDANLRWVVGLVVGAGILGIAIHFGILWFFENRKQALDVARKSRFPLAAAPNNKLPREPHLEQIDRLDKVQDVNIYLRQKAKLDILNSYGEMKEKGIVHIPVDRAIKLLANKLPARSDPAAAVGASLAAAVGALGAPQGQGPLVALATLMASRDRLNEAAMMGRQNGLVGGGEPNSGRLFNTRKPSWLGH